MDDDWTPDRIRELRHRLELRQVEFGLLIWSTSEGTAQKEVSRIENGRRGVRAAEKRTLERLEEVAEVRAGERDIDELDLSRFALAHLTR